jgi:thioredoxin-related protein
MNKIIVLMIFIVNSSAFANRANTLEGNNSLAKPTEKEISQSADRVKIPENFKIPDEWMPLLNPAHEEFWVEGNHKADAGFILFARNPTKENAKLWLIRMETKAKYLEVMMSKTAEAQKELVSEGLIEDRYGMVSNATFLPRSTPRNNQVNIKNLIKNGMGKISSVEMYFIFSPTCPYCEKMSESLSGFKNVQPLQVISGKLRDFKGLPKTTIATKETLEKYAPDGAVPVLVIHDPKSNKVNVVKGYLSKEEVYISIAKLLDSKG